MITIRQTIYVLLGTILILYVGHLDIEEKKLQSDYLFVLNNK